MPETIFTSWAARAAGLRPGIAGVILLAAALVTGCTAPVAGSAASPPTATPPVATVPATAQPAAQATPEVLPATGATPGATGGPAALVKLAQNGQFGQILADDKGMTLYLYTKDTKNTSNCYDQCATAWPPLVTSAMPTGGAGVDPSLLSTTTRRDGQMQVTYNGWPLYYWFKDQKPGDATGENVGGVWFVVSPSGDKVAPTGSPASTPGPARSSPAYP